MSGPSYSALRQQLVWDGLGLDSPYSGVGHYGASLYEAMSTLGRDPLVTAIIEPPAFVKTGNCIYISEKRESLLEKITSLEKLFRLKPVFPNISYEACTKRFPAILYHGLSNLNLPCFTQKRAQDKYIITIHDLIPLMTDRWSPLSIQTRILLPRVISLADAIIVPSGWTRSTLIEHYGTRVADKIYVIPNGSRPLRSRPVQGAQLPGQKTIEVLSIARGESYKRLEFVEFVARAMPEARFLLITDEQGKKRIKDPPRNLQVLTKVQREDLVTAYNSARVFMHPSLYEGWCLPAADAIQAGLITLFVKGTGIDDVCGFAPQFAMGMGAHQSPNDWVEAVRIALKQSQDRHDGERAATLPSWLDNAEKTLKIYDSLI